MPDWAMILLKCVLWWLFVHGAVVLALQMLRGRPSHRVNVAWPIIAAVILAALEGWITP